LPMRAAISSLLQPSFTSSATRRSLGLSRCRADKADGPSSMLAREVNAPRRAFV